MTLSETVGEGIIYFAISSGSFHSLPGLLVHMPAQSMSRLTAFPVRFELELNSNLELYSVSTLLLLKSPRLSGYIFIDSSTPRGGLVSRSRRFELRNQSVSSPSTRKTQYCRVPP